MASQNSPVTFPRVAITYCTQCRWMLRAAYFGQELLSTFQTQIGEIALIPATGGLFTVELTYIPPGSETEGQDAEIKKVLLWDRKAEGGFPETKVLKQRVRDHIDPNRDLGHSDRHGKKKEEKIGADETEKKEEKEEEKPNEKSRDESSEHKGGSQQNVTDEGVELKRNPDGSLCEDCR